MMMMMGVGGGGGEICFFFGFSLVFLWDVFTTWFAATIITQLSLVAFIGSLKRERYIYGGFFFLGAGEGKGGRHKMAFEGA